MGVEQGRRLTFAELNQRANRLANCDEANARRAAAAARRQTELARTLLADPRWPALPQALREAAELRLRHPYLSLQELARKRRPPLTKSTLNHRFRRIEQLVGR